MEWTTFGLPIILLLLIKHVTSNCLPGYVSYEGDCYGGPRDLLLSWSQAEQHCVNLKGHLTSVTSQAEHNFINSVIRNYNSQNPELWNEVWIGLYHTYPISYDTDYTAHRLGWQWLDGEAYSYRAWGHLDPSKNEKYARIANGVWLGSLNGDMHHNFICKIKANRLRVNVPQPYPNPRTTLPPHLRNPMRTTRYPPIATKSPTGYWRFPWEISTQRSTHIAAYPRATQPHRWYPFDISTQGSTENIINSNSKGTQPQTKFQVVTPTTPHKDGKNSDEMNFIDTFSVNDRNENAVKTSQEETDSGFKMEYLPIAAGVPTVAIVMVVILVGIICSRKRYPKSKTNKKADPDTKIYSDGFHATPISTITNDPTRVQYYNETYRSLSGLLRMKNAKLNNNNLGLMPPVYGNSSIISEASTIKKNPALYTNNSISGYDPSTLKSVKSCYENDYTE